MADCTNFAAARITYDSVHAEGQVHGAVLSLRDTR